MRHWRLAAIVVFLWPASSPEPAFAQSDRGPFAALAGSAITIDETTTATVSTTLGYRFSPALALGVEVTIVPRFTPDAPDLPVPLSDYEGILYPTTAIRLADARSHATMFTGNLQLTLPTGMPRVSPYLVVGGGVAALTDRIDITFTYPPVFIAGIVSPSIFPPPVLPPIRRLVSRTTTDFVATVGGGVSVKVSDRWSIDADARYFEVTGARDIRTGRFGAGTTFRF